MNERKQQNFRAFTKLYGYVRFFHPSDEASSIDWDKFAIYGFEKIENARDDKELKALLLELFLPIAPSIEVYLTGEEIKYDLNKIIPADTTGLLPVAWQHFGIVTDKNEFYQVYNSQRVNRIFNLNTTGLFSKRIDLSKLKGKKIRVTSWCKIQSQSDNSEAEIFINDGGGENKVKITEDKWKEYSAEIIADKNLKVIDIGCRLKNEGVLLINGFKISVFDSGKWNDLNYPDLMFADQETNSTPAEWEISKEGYIYKIIDFDTCKNEKSCFIESKFDKQPFENHTQPGELAIKKINDDLKCVIPLCLYSDENATLPVSGRGINELIEKISAGSSNITQDDNVYTRLAVSAIIWNVVQHAYPYFEHCNADWEESLSDLLENAYQHKKRIEFLDGVHKITANLNDGHIGMSHPDLLFKYFYPPFLIDFAENKFVVSKIFEENSEMNAGDILLEIDEVEINSLADSEMRSFSASTYGRKLKNILPARLLKAENNKRAKLKILRDEKELTIYTERSYNFRDFLEKGLYPEYRPEKFRELKQGIFYIDLSRHDAAEFEEKLPILANADGVIFDIRGYPAFSSEFLNQLTNISLRSSYWLIPQITYPDRENIIYSFEDSTWEWEAAKPKFKGRVIFLTDANAISWAETILTIVKEYKLGIIIGAQTAGTNGDINRIKLPGNYSFRFTRMKVLKHDKSPFHGVGILPDIPVQRTIKGIREKRDEFLEKALEIIEGK